MDMTHPAGAAAAKPESKTALPGQVVLAFQGGGALNAYQGGVYQALHEAGIEPDWVIGTSSGAINAGIIAGNPPGQRLDRLREFWTSMEFKPWWEDSPFLAPWLGNSRLAAELSNQAAHVSAFFGGIPGYYAPNHALAMGVNAPLGVERASLYTTEGLAKTLGGLTDPAWFNSGRPRLTVSTVNVKTGRMQYWDSARMPLTLNHVLASAALPISFPAVRIDGDPYWDGGIYSNLEDLAKWDDALRNHTLLTAEEMAPALVPAKLADGSQTFWPAASNDDNLHPGKPVSYGFGWFLDPYQEHPRMWHTGSTLGFRTVIERFTADNLTIIVLCNHTDLDPEALALKTADLYLNVKPKE